MVSVDPIKAAGAVVANAKKSTAQRGTAQHSTAQQIKAPDKKEERKHDVTGGRSVRRETARQLWANG